MTQSSMNQPASGAAGQRRGVNVVLWGLQIITAAVFVIAAFPKVTADPMAVAGFQANGLGEVGMYVIGALEIAGAVALLIPLLSGLAGLAFVGLMIGAVIITALTFSIEFVVIPAVVLVLVAIIAWGRRQRTAQLIALVRSYLPGQARAR